MSEQQKQQRKQDSPAIERGKPSQAEGEEETVDAKLGDSGQAVGPRHSVHPTIEREPPSQAEGDEETVDENLRQQEKKSS